MKPLSLRTASFVLTILFYLFWWQTSLLSFLDYKAYDRLTHDFPPSKTPDSTVVIEIDDKSLKTFGQWPWPRMLTAELIKIIADSNPSAIVLEIIFAEKDRSSPDTFLAFYRDYFNLDMTINGMPSSLLNNDRVLAEAIGHTNTILPVFGAAGSNNKTCPLPFMARKRPEIQIDHLRDIEALLCNLPIYQERAKGIGHICSTTDGDGILRRLPLLMRHDDALIPALGIAAVASVYPYEMHPIPPYKGDVSIQMAKNTISVNEQGDALLTFYPHELYERISAVDVLNGAYDPARLQGKFVLVGPTSFGLDPWFTLSDGSIRPGIFIHATAVENLLNGDFNVQPTLYQSLNIILSLLSALVLLMIMSKKRYLDVLFVFVVFLLSSLLITYLAWQRHIYPSIGYFLVPLISYLFILALLMFFINYSNSKKFMAAIRQAMEQQHLLTNELHRSENEIEYHKAMLFQQSKLASMGEMINNIAHQWRQPLNILGMIIQDVEYAYRKDRIDQNYIRTMTSESMEQIVFMSHTIDDFSNFTKPGSHNAPFDLNQPVAKTLKLLTGMFGSNHIAVNVHYSDKTLEIYGSASEFKQVLINLLNNSRDALIANHPHNPTITIRIFGDDTNGAITIEDNGGGIEPEAMQRIFEPYFTTKGEGSGIGLYMSYAIIHTHMKGTIEASNTEEGASFTLTLPLWKGDLK